MAKNVLPVDFQDDILTEDMDGRRRYKMITNADGTVSFVDATEYTQVGNNFGQAQINATNEAVNESADKNKIIDTKADLMANTQDGMIAGALAVKAAVSELTENRGHAYGEKFTSGNTDIDITKWAVTSLLCIATYNETAMYVIRKETSSKIFCLPIKSSTQLTVSKNGENSISLANSMTEGGNWTVFY